MWPASGSTTVHRDNAGSESDAGLLGSSTLLGSESSLTLGKSGPSSSDRGLPNCPGDACHG